jgi:hypothetical protein
VFPNRRKGNIYVDENEPRMNTAMSRDIINATLKQISKRNGLASRGSDSVQGTVLRAWGSENGSLVSMRMKDLCEQQEILTTQVGALKEIYEYRLTKLEQEVKNAMAKVVSEVGVKYSLLNEKQEKFWKELLEKIDMREFLGQIQRGEQEDFPKKSDQLLQLERKFLLLEETMKHTKDTVDQIFSFICLQQTNT